MKRQELIIYNKFKALFLMDNWRKRDLTQEKICCWAAYATVKYFDGTEISDYLRKLGDSPTVKNLSKLLEQMMRDGWIDWNAILLRIANLRDSKSILRYYGMNSLPIDNLHL